MTNKVIHKITIDELVKFADYIDGLSCIYHLAESNFIDNNVSSDLIEFIDCYERSTCNIFSSDLQCAAIKKIENYLTSARFLMRTI